MATRPRKAEVQRQDVPPPIDTRFVPIVRATVGTTQHFVILSDALVGVWTHYHMLRTIPCIGRRTGCICSTVQLAKRWTGYLACWWPQQGRQCLVEVTIDCHRNAPKLFAPGRNLRGTAIGLFRLVQRANGPVRMYEEGKMSGDELEKVGPPVDVMRCLYATWGYSPDDIGK